MRDIPLLETERTRSLINICYFQAMMAQGNINDLGNLMMIVSSEQAGFDADQISRNKFYFSNNRGC